MVNIAKYTVKLVKESTTRYNIDKKISCPNDAANLFREVFDTESLAEEILILACVNTKNVVTGVFEVCRGSLNSSVVHPRDVFKRALANNASGVIIAHNHPSGDASPSNEDISTTKRLKV